MSDILKMIGAIYGSTYLEYKSAIDLATINFDRSVKKIDIYRKYVPNPDQQPRNEKCKCGSGKKYKVCCIKK